MDFAQALVFFAGMAVIAGIFYAAFRFTFDGKSKSGRQPQVKAPAAKADEKLVAAE